MPVTLRTVPAPLESRARERQSGKGDADETAIKNNC